MEIHGIGLLSAFVAGVVSFLSPCILPLVPAYVSFLAGESLDTLKSDAQRSKRVAILLLSLLFVLGFSTVFILLGASATAVGELLFQYRGILETVAGVIVVLFGLVMMGLFRLPVLQRDFRFHLNIPGGQPAAAYVLGAAFGFGWTPCIGPILGGILTMAAVSSTVTGGMVLLAIYSAGLGVPFLLAAGFTGFFLRHMRGLGRLGRNLQIAAGVILVLMGVAMITGYLSAFAFWLLETFPFLYETVR
ncbi:MAG: cytochrome C biogenesis protein [Rhodospirillaceae bacterium]|nr:cytochrome C biogenesis protein [Rhodospirillaceae bacterium]|tara:strand:+ start:2466 stop:3206 length:741 start_codon:yes stop_codon:yes gene_type:complete